MSSTWRRVLTIVAVVVLGLGLLGVGFVLGRNSLGLTNVISYGRFRPGVLGFGLGFGGVFSIILNVLFWALVVGLIVWVVSSLVSGRATSHLPSNTATPSESALDILNKRYARGEITKTEYEDMRRNLGA